MRDVKDSLLVFLKGLFMGTADIIPGISGGTIALITGIYTRLIDAIDYVAELFNPKEWPDLSDWEAHRENIGGIDWALFVPLILGIVAAFVLLSNLIHFFLDAYEQMTYSFFFGVILASAYFLYHELDETTMKTGLISFLGFVAGLEAVTLQPVGAEITLPLLFVTGAIAICALILPGISGAFILLILGQYQYVLGIIRDYQIVELGVFGLGAATGILLFSRLLHYLLHRYRNETMGFLTGLMLGSLRLPLGIVVNEGLAGQVPGILISGVVGVGAVFLLEKLS